jgi:hypothetical protein
MLYLKRHLLKNQLNKQEYDIRFLVNENGNAMKNSTEITIMLNEIFNLKKYFEYAKKIYFLLINILM